ncbi:Tannase/feruloyl esterase [Ilyonectria destructans]|nr:Tannase/feruloyl esterase [Ilyonectria destructans]
MFLGLLALVPLTSALAQHNGTFDSQCAALAQTLNIANSTLWTAEIVPAGTTITYPNNPPTCQRPSQAVSSDMCRVGLNVSTSSRSEVMMEMWLPRDWSGRFLSTGNGGTGGCIQYEDLAYASALGFAAVGTNNGHDGFSGVPFYNNSDVVQDFAWRAVHTGVVVGKQIANSFYGPSITKSYYLGCSTGGRQGLKMAQMFPEEFDGIVAGAPAISYNNLTSWSGHFYPLTGSSTSSRFVPRDMWSVIHQDILDQCDALDGYVDGILEDPMLCDYNPDGLLCAASNGTTSSTGCLTSAQATVVRSIFSALRDSSGSLVHPRMQPGSELGASQVYYGGVPFQYTTEWFRYAVFGDPSWDPATLSSADIDFASQKNPFDIESFQGDLSKLRDGGSKLLHWHGLQDPIITSDISPRYYEHVAASMNQTPEELDDFYRFFRVSGTNHCSGGPGATFIGNQAKSNATLDPDGNVLMAMVRWVEEGVAPDTIQGVAYVNQTKSSGVIDFERKHCRYPYRNVYNGTGNPKSANSWSCVASRDGLTYL